MLITIHVLASRFGHTNVYTKTFKDFKEVQDFIDYEIYGDHQYVYKIYLRAFRKREIDQRFEVTDKIFEGKEGGNISGYEEFKKFCKNFFEENDEKSDTL